MTAGEESSQAAVNLRPFVTFLARRQDREKAHRWLNFLSSPEAGESPRSRDSRVEALSRLQEMVRAGRVSSPFLHDPPDAVATLLSGQALPRRMREAQMHSELLNLQSKQQSELEEIVWQKNQEMEDLRHDFQLQLQSISARRLEKEMQLAELARTRDELLRAAAEEKEALVAELQQNADNHHAGQMQRLQNLVDRHVEERQRCQEQHQDSCRDLEADVVARIDAVRDDSCRRLSQHAQHISALETDLHKCETRLRTRQKEVGVLEEEQEQLGRRERQVEKETTAMKAKLKTLQERTHLLHEKCSEETAAVMSEFRQLTETERTELAAASRAATDVKERLSGDLRAAKQRLASVEEANAVVMRETGEAHRRALEELREDFEKRITEAARRHESATTILREKLSNRVDDGHSAAAELARVVTEVDSARRRGQEDVGQLQARCTVESARQLETVRQEVERLKQELSNSERTRDRCRIDHSSLLLTEQSRHAADLDRLRSSVDRQRATLLVSNARELEEERLRHETEGETTATPLTSALTAAEQRGVAQHAAMRERMEELRKEEEGSRREAEERRKERREALVKMGAERKEEVERRKEEMKKELKEEKERARREEEETTARCRREKEKLEIQFNRTVEELARRQGTRMEEALSMTSRLDDCIRGLVSVNYLLADRLRDVASHTTG